MRAGILLLLLVAGCPPPPVQRLYPPPTAQDLWRSLWGRHQKLLTLHADVKVDHKAEKGDRVKLNVAMTVARVGKLRLEAQSPLIGPVAVLVSDGVEFAFLDSRGHKYYFGRASACNVARLIRVQIPPVEISEILLSGTPLQAEIVGNRWDERGREVLDLRTSTGTLTVWLDAKDKVWDPVEVQKRAPDGTPIWRVRHQDYELRQGFRLPTFTEIEDQRHRVDVKLRYRETEVNLPVGPEVFKLEVPVGIDREAVDCPD